MNNRDNGDFRGLGEILGQLFERMNSGPPDMQWHRATVSSLTVKGLSRLFKENVKLGDEMFVAMACEHKRVGIDPERDESAIILTRHAWTGKGFEDMPVEVLTVGEPVEFFSCAICDTPSFVSMEERRSMQNRPELPGPRKSGDTCATCWTAIEPLAGNETMIEISKQFRKHFFSCRRCQFSPLPCREGLKLLNLVDTIKFEGKSFTDIMTELRKNSPGFEEQVKRECDDAGLGFLLEALSASLR